METVIELMKKELETIGKAINEHTLEHKEYKDCLDKKIDGLEQRMMSYFDNSIDSHLEVKGKKLFANKETEETVSDLKSWLLKSGLVIIAGLIVTIVILLKFITNQ